ncbi:hypothetical protein [Caldovatus aquaticus]|uniref:Uncharacterized protein n=1 Tax=Caldovatus aquaticus TaxID=2865671 RepID=A0ABS7EY75_9PROT|nr:hypothetical protein [Caldovatus aquaticus]MBW8268307.1 hypothetical protein [Caldovatus aquaticus]
MNELIAARHDHRAVTPVTAAHAHRLRDMDPTWGLYPHLRPDAHDPVHLDLPGDDVLAVMELELARALLPCADPVTGEGMDAAAAAAGVLIESWPQKDASSPTYAEQVAMRLAACPRDLLPKVIARLVDEEEFRPSVAKVRQAVERELAKRRLLLAKVQAARRWWAWRVEEDWRQAEIAADREAAAERVAQGLAATLRLADAPPAPAATPATAPPSRPVRPAHLSPEQLARARARPAHAHDPAMMQE